VKYYKINSSDQRGTEGPGVRRVLVLCALLRLAWLTAGCTPLDRIAAFASACGLHGAVHGLTSIRIVSVLIGCTCIYTRTVTAAAEANTLLWGTDGCGCNCVASLVSLFGTATGQQRQPQKSKPRSVGSTGQLIFTRAKRLMHV
jgi:hypothetical protein